MRPIDLSQFRLAMFDLDGTLVDSAIDIHVALNRTLNRFERNSVTEQQTRCWVGNGARVLVNRALHGALKVDDEHPDLDVVLEQFLLDYSEENGVSSKPYVGVSELFEQLRNLAVHIAIVTNKPFAPAKDLIDQLDIRCDLLIGGDSVERKKPDPQPLHMCLEHFAVPASQAFMVGDSINDFQAARAAGVTSIGVSYGYNHGLPIDPRNVDALVDSLLELG